MGHPSRPNPGLGGSFVSCGDKDHRPTQVRDGGSRGEGWEQGPHSNHNVDTKYYNCCCLRIAPDSCNMGLPFEVDAILFTDRKAEALKHEVTYLGRTVVSKGTCI